MSFKGEIEAHCPKGCESFQAEVWSFIRGDTSPALRLTVLCRECNLLLCPSCGMAFFPSEPYVYYEPRAEILAFVFPEEYRSREDYWHEKMQDDFKRFKEGLGQGMPVAIEPEIFFGSDDLARLLESEDCRSEEREVMEHVAKGLGLSLYRVSPRYARKNGIPDTLPYLARPGRKATPESVVKGLEKLVAANERLTAYSGYLAALKSAAASELPPPASKPSPATVKPS